VSRFLKLAEIGSLVRKVVGIDEDMLGLILHIDKDSSKLPAYVVFTENGEIAKWMTCFVDVLNEP
jgi:hypothetical protein